MNVTLLRGVLRAEPAPRSLPSGGLAVEFELATVSHDGAGERVPVVSYTELPAFELAVLGRVRTRFFRSGAQTLARTEVVAERVVPTRRRVPTRRIYDEAIDALCADRDGPPAR